MATELGQAYVQIMPSAKGISGSIKNQILPEADSAGKSAGSSLGGSLIRTVSTVIAAAGIGKVIGASITEGAHLQQSLGGIETLFKGSADKVKKYANDAYKTSGLSANDYMENVTSFSASLLQSLGGNTAKAADKANMAMIDMSDNSNKMGTNMGDIQNAYQGFAKQNYTMLDNLKLGYGGTKEEMQRLLKDATKLTGVKYDINNLSDVYSAIHAVQGQLGITGTTAKEAASTFSGSFDSMKAAASNVLGKMALGQDITPSLNALAKTASTFLFGNFIPMLGNILKAIPGALVTFIKAAIPQVKSGLNNLLNGGFKGFGDAVKNSMSGIAGGVGIAIAAFAGFKILTPILSLVSGGIGKLTSPLTSLIGKLPNVGKGFSSMGSAISGAASSILKIGVGIGVAAAGIGLMSLGFAKLAGTGNAGIAIIAATAIAIGGIAGILAVLGPALTANAVGIGVFGASMLAIGAGIGLASAGIALLLMSIQSLGNNLILIIPTLTAIGVGFASMITGFITTLAVNMPIIALSITNMITTMLLTLAAAMPQMVAAGMSILMSFLMGINNNIFNITTVVILIITNFLNAITVNMPRIVSSGANLIVSFLNGLAQQLPRIITAAVNVIVSFVNGIAANLGKIINAGVNLLGKFILGVVNAIPKIVNIAVQAVGKFVYGIGYALGKVMSSGTKLIGMFIKGIIGGISGSRSAGKRNGDAIIGVLKSIKLLSIGKNIVQGLINGIGSMVGAVGKAIGKIADKVKGGIKGALGIHSPSRVMFEYGGYTGEGFANGISSTTSTIAKRAKEMAKAAVPNMKIGLPKIDNSSFVKSIGDVNGTMNARNSSEMMMNYVPQTINDSMIKSDSFETDKNESDNSDLELLRTIDGLKKAIDVFSNKQPIAVVNGSSFASVYEGFGSVETAKRNRLNDRGLSLG